MAVLKHGYVNSAGIQADAALNLVPHMIHETSHAVQSNNATLVTFLATKFILRRLKTVERALMIEHEVS